MNTPRTPRDARALRWVMALTLALWTALAAPAPAAAQPAGDASAAPGERPEQLRERIQARVRELRNRFLTEELALDEATAAALFAILDRRQEVVFRTEVALRRAQRALEEATEAQPPPSEQALRERTEQVLKLRDEVHAARRELYDEASAVLTPMQQARLAVALPVFERQVRRLIRRARQEARGGRRGGRRDHPGRGGARPGGRRGGGPGHPGPRRWDRERHPGPDGPPAD